MFDRDYFNTLEHGEERMSYLKKEIAEADAQKDIKTMIDLRYRYINESVFHGDSFKGLLMFPEYMKLVDDNPDDADIVDFMFAFKWIIENSREFYQIPMEQIEGYFDSYKEHLERYGYTPRTYNFKKAQFYRNIDPKKALKYLSLFDRFERTQVSDCKACEAGFMAEMELRFGSAEKAVSMLNEMQQRNMRCAEVPQATYACFADNLSRMGYYDEAEHYAELALPMMKGEYVNFTYEISSIIELKTVTDINAAYDLICETLHLFSGLKNQLYRFYYAEAAYRFFDRYLKGGNDPVIPMKLSAEFEKYSEDGKYDAAELRDWFYGIAEDLARKFDERNQSDFCTKHLAFEFPESPEQELKLPMHSTVKASSMAYAIPLFSQDDLPDIDSIHAMLTDGSRFDEVMLFRGSDEEQVIIITAKKHNSDSYEIRLMLRDPIDVSAFKQSHYLPEGTMDKLAESEASCIITVQGGKSNHARLKLMIDILGAVSSSSGAVLDLVNSRVYSHKWVKLEAEGESVPYNSYFYRVWIYQSAFKEGCYDLVAGGLESCGQRELFIPAVSEEAFGSAQSFLRQVANYALYGDGLPDEGLDFNCGIVYADKGFCRVKWEPFDSPAEDEDVVFMQPIIALPGADKEFFRPITELSEEELSALSFRSSARSSDNDEKKHAERFARIFEFYKAHADSCELCAGYAISYADEDEEDLEAYPYLRLYPDGSGEVVNADVPALGLKIGDKTEQPADKIYTWKLVHGEDEFYADDLYMLEDIIG